MMFANGAKLTLWKGEKTMREYLSVEEAAKSIAGEVMHSGASAGWVGNTDIARDLEKHLAKFNIGCTNPKTGTWGHRTNGTRYFITMKWMDSAKSKLGSVVSGLTAKKGS